MGQPVTILERCSSDSFQCFFFHFTLCGWSWTPSCTLSFTGSSLGILGFQIIYQTNLPSSESCPKNAGLFKFSCQQWHARLFSGTFTKQMRTCSLTCYCGGCIVELLVGGLQFCRPLVPRFCCSSFVLHCGMESELFSSVCWSPAVSQAVHCILNPVHCPSQGAHWEMKDLESQNPQTALPSSESCPKNTRVCSATSLPPV